jgi:hypothetical protein
MAAPAPDPRRATELTAELARAASALAPDWAGVADNGDFGSALYRIAARLGEQVTRRMDRAPDRDRLAFYETLELPGGALRAATVPIAFTLADKRDARVDTPKGLQLAARGGAVPFETGEALQISPARIGALMAVDPATDRLELAPAAVIAGEPRGAPRGPLRTLTPSSAGSTFLQLSGTAALVEGDLLRIAGPVYRVAKIEGDIVTLVDPLEGAVAAEAEIVLVENLEAFALRNLQEHVVYIGHKELLNLEQPATVELRFDPAAIASRLVALDVAVEIWATREADEEPAWHALGADAGQGALRLTKSWFGSVEQVEIDGRKSRWLRIRLQAAIDPDGPPQTLVKRISMIVASAQEEAGEDDAAKPAEGDGTVKAAYHNALPLSLSGPFYPFGTEPQRFDTFAIAAPEALSKPGAQVTLTVSLADSTQVALALAAGRANRAYGLGKDGALHVFLAELDEQSSALPRLTWRRLDAGLGATAGAGPPERLELDTILPLAAVLRDQERDLLVAADGAGNLWARFVIGPDRALQLGAAIPLGKPEQAPEATFIDYALVGTSREALVVALTADSLYFLSLGGADEPAASAWTKPSSGGVLFGEGMAIAAAIGTEGAAQLPTAPAFALIDAAGELYRGIFTETGGAWTITWRNTRVCANPGVRPLIAGNLDSHFIAAAEPLPADPDQLVSPLLALIVPRASNLAVQAIPVPEILVRNETALAPVPPPARGGGGAVAAWTGAELTLWGPGLAPLRVPTPSDEPVAIFFPGAGIAPAVAMVLGAGEVVLRRALPPFAPVAVELFDAVPALAPDPQFAVGDLPAEVKRFAFSGIDVAGEWLYGARPPGLLAAEEYVVVTVDAGFTTGVLASATKLHLDGGDTWTAAGSFVIVNNLLHEVASVGSGVATLAQPSPAALGPIRYDVATASPPRTIPPDYVGTLVRCAVDPGPAEEMLFEQSAAPGVQRVAASEGPWLLLGDAWTTIPQRMMAVPIPAAGAWAGTRFPRDYESPELAWEYPDGKTWRRLDVADGTANLAHGGDIAFTVPADHAEIEVAGTKDLWIRARLIGGDYGRAKYRIEFVPPEGSPRTETIQIDTSALNPPEIDTIGARFAIALPVEPQAILTSNNLAVLDQSQASRAGDARFDLFPGIARHVAQAAGQTRDDEAGRSLYLRLTKAPDVDLLACYVDAEERDVEAAELAADILTASGWQPVRGLDDGTAGLNRPGMILLPLQTKPDELPLFGSSGWWLRLHPREEGADWAPRLRGLFLNAAMATQAKTLVQELVGSSDGSPNQHYALAYAPLLPKSLDLRVRESLSDEEREAIIRSEGADAIAVAPDIAGTWLRWRQAESFAGMDGEARVFRLDPAKGEILFGDNRRGRIPPAGADAIRAFFYQNGGGSSGNVEAGEITSVKSAVQSLDRAVNPVAASGGADIEPPERIQAAAVARLRHAGRLLAPSDVEAFACASAPDVAAARCLPGVGGGFALIVSLRQPGVRAAMVSRTRREGLAAALAEQGSGAVAAARIDVRSPVYVRTAIRAELVVADARHAAEVQRAAHRALSDLLDPTLGPGKKGGGFGLRIEEGDVYRALAGMDGLDRIEAIVIEGGPVGPDSLAFGEEDDANASVRIGGAE